MDKKNTTLFILPGWGGSETTWKPFIKVAKKDFDDVVCINLPCFGDEPCPKNPYGVKGYSKFVEKNIKEYKSNNKNNKIFLLGHSFGGQVATQLLSTNQDIVDHLILVGAAVIRPKKYLRRGILLVISKLGFIIFQIPFLSRFFSIARGLLYRIIGSPDYAKTSGVQKEVFKIVTREDLTSKLIKIKVPTTVIWGDKDTYTRLTYGKIIAKLIPRSTLVVIKGGKHGLHIDKTNELIKHIRKLCY